MLRSGELRWMVDIEEDIGDDNLMEERWRTKHPSVPAKVQELAGGEAERGVQLEADIEAVVTIRAIDGLSPMMRLRHRGSTYEIRRIVDRTGMNRELEIQCAKVDD